MKPHGCIALNTSFATVELCDIKIAVDSPRLSRRPRILVVEDDAPLAHLYCTALTMSGLAVMRAGDGMSALRVVEEYRPDLVVLDLMLPHIDGWTVLKEFESRAAIRSIPVVVVTGSDTGLGLPHAKAVIRKPADPDYVVKIVSKHLPPRPASV
jgi:DNA-binding response OmpR family regulator